MDLGIRGKWAVVCAASKGLGYSCAQALADEGVNIVINARGAVDLQAANATLEAKKSGGRSHLGYRRYYGSIDSPIIGRCRAAS